MKPDLMTDELAECLSELQDLSDAKIVNLTGYTNTDLKLKYGTANITILSDCSPSSTKRQARRKKSAA